MLRSKFAGVLLSAGLCVGLVGCPGEDDEPSATTGGVTNGMMMTDGNATDASGGMTGSMMTTTTMTTGGDGETTDEASSSGEESDTAPMCMDTDECMVDGDCAKAGAMCLSCLCVGGTAACEPGQCGNCADAGECIACTQQPGGECVAEIGACNMNKVCLAILMCQNECGMDQPCAEACVTDNPDGADDFNAVIGCILPVCT